MTDTATINTYVVYAVHPNGDTVSLQLIATSEQGAIARSRGTLFHQGRSVGWLHGYYHIAAIYAGERNNTDPYPEQDETVVEQWVEKQSDLTTADPEVVAWQHEHLGADYE